MSCFWPKGGPQMKNFPGAYKKCITYSNRWGRYGKEKVISFRFWKGLIWKIHFLILIVRFAFQLMSSDGNHGKLSNRSTENLPGNLGFLLFLTSNDIQAMISPRESHLMDLLPISPNK